MQGSRQEPERAIALCHCLDHIWAFFVLSKAVDDDSAPVGKDCLDPKFTPYRMIRDIELCGTFSIPAISDCVSCLALRSSPRAIRCSSSRTRSALSARLAGFIFAWSSLKFPAILFNSSPWRRRQPWSRRVALFQLSQAPVVNGIPSLPPGPPDAVQRPAMLFAHQRIIAGNLLSKTPICYIENSP